MLSNITITLKRWQSAVLKERDITSGSDSGGDLLGTKPRSLSFYSRSESTLSQYDLGRRSLQNLKTPSARKKICYDWIFSSGSNVHVAVDQAAFKTYTPFKSYILAVSNQRQVPVYGIGAVDIKIRRRPGSNGIHTVHLEDVLHVPDWPCNILSDAHFMPTRDYDHSWSDNGLNFFHKESGKLRAWGYTENFFGLEKIVLARKSQGRSPMLEDENREVYSINVIWPKSNREEWLHFLDCKTTDKHIHMKPNSSGSLREPTQAITANCQQLEDNPQTIHTDVSGRSHGLRSTSRNVLARISSNMSLRRKSSVFKSINLSGRISRRASIRERLI